MPLYVDTLAFQQQDSVAAACATSALWSAFHGTGVLFQHRIPSPVEITQLANAHLQSDGRVLPSPGLTESQMASAVHAVGLEQTIIRASDESILKGAAYSYVRGKVPVLLLGDLVDVSDPGKPVFLGRHAIVVTGYSLSNRPPKPGSLEILLQSSRIDRIYCHDDQVGPFARMADSEITLPDESGTPAPTFALTTSYLDDNGQRGNVRFLPESLLVPLYHKVRILFDDVVNELRAFELFLSKHLPDIQISLNWDVYLASSNELKVEIRENPEWAAGRRTLLELGMPKFVWRARATLDSVPQFEIFFDATGIAYGSYCFKVAEFDRKLGDVLRAMAADVNLFARMKADRWWRVIGEFLAA
ncbi:hypothetical protein [Sorangium sp. So ce1389]|uniref:hypothetical protein n=1 Tax=Sorangium sp. So ce1389 TaxID=3133336 RepID=UPI003F5FA670